MEGNFLMARIRWRKGEIGAMKIKMRNIDEKAKTAIAAIVDRQGAIGEGRMKTGAPWSDITGAARNGLHVNAQHSPGGHSLTFAHSVHYGIWLEVKNSGKYEIIMPTVRATGQAIMQDMDHLFGKI